MHRQIERVSYSHRKRTKGTTVEGINPTNTKKFFKKIELRILTLSSGVSYAVLTRPNKAETAVHGC